MYAWGSSVGVECAAIDPDGTPSVGLERTTGTVEFQLLSLIPGDGPATRAQLYSLNLQAFSISEAEMTVSGFQAIGQQSIEATSGNAWCDHQCGPQRMAEGNGLN